jgi:hypothetical protein
VLVYLLISALFKMNQYIVASLDDWRQLQDKHSVDIRYTRGGTLIAGC